MWSMRWKACLDNAASLDSCLGGRRPQRFLVPIFLIAFFPGAAVSQCTGVASTPGAAADCAAHSVRARRGHTAGCRALLFAGRAD